MCYFYEYLVCVFLFTVAVKITFEKRPKISKNYTTQNCRIVALKWNLK